MGSLSGFIRGGLYGKLGVKFLSMIVIPREHGIDLSHCPLRIFFDDLLRRESLLMQRYDLVDRHAGTVDA
jgi:hypothetical protein